MFYMVKYGLVKPITNEEARPYLALVFNSQKGNKGSHSILDSPWSKILTEFSELINVSELLKRFKERAEIDILDEGCGSSLTLFQAVEELEKDRTGLTNGYGITASPEFLMQGASSPIREEMLNRFNGNPQERKKLELLLQGVQCNSTKGFHRYSPRGNLIRIVKGDLHYFPQVLNGKSFDMIYSSATYPHLECPGLVFEKSVNSLKRDGLLLIDSLPICTIVDGAGNSLTAEECKKRLENRNPNYKVDMKSDSNPFYVPVIVERTSDKPFNAGELYSGTDLNQQKRILTVLD